MTDCLYLQGKEIKKSARTSSPAKDGAQARTQRPDHGTEDGNGLVMVAEVPVLQSETELGGCTYPTEVCI